jgi:P pilus assembly chaperone PapD
MLRKSFILILALGAVILPSAALEVSQIEFDLQVPAGGSGTYSFLVHNDEQITDDIKIYLVDWDRDAEGNHRFYEPGSLPRSNTSWITVTPTSFSLRPDEAREVRFTITVPPDVQGTYWGMIMVEGRPRPQEREGATVLVVPRFGIKVYVTPPWTGTSAGRITKVQRLGLNPLTFLIGFENTGDVHLRVSGEVQVLDGRGELVEKIAVAQFPILPGAVREVRASGSAPRPAPGRYYALAVLDFGSPDYLPAGQLIFDVPELRLVPIGGAASPPRDLDGDGFFEDVDGDGAFTSADPDLLEANLTTAAVQNNWPAFDFDNDGDADGEDVALLRGLLSRG